MDISLREAIFSLLDYSWKDEQKHWNECDRPNEHIYHALKTIRDNFGLHDKYPNESTEVEV